MKFLRELTSDIRCGLHSNIPLCDIAFHCVYWGRHYSVTSNLFNRWYNSRSRQHWVQYVQCPVCLIFKVRGRPLHLCENDNQGRCHLTGAIEPVPDPQYFMDRGI